MRKIYIVNDSGHDFKAAKLFAGEFIILTIDKVNVFATDRIKRQIEKKMEGAEKGDLLLLSGNTILNVLAAMILMMRTGEASFLIFNHITSKYERRNYVLGDFQIGLEEGNSHG